MSSTTDVSSSSRRPQSKSKADKSSPGSSSASRSKSQSLSLLLLSTSRRAFTCSGVRSSTQTQGTSSMPSFFAARARQCPITITPSRSITIGCTNPYCLMLSATLLICRLSCFFAFAEYGTISASRRFVISMPSSCFATSPHPLALHSRLYPPRGHTLALNRSSNQATMHRRTFRRALCPLPKASSLLFWSGETVSSRHTSTMLPIAIAFASASARRICPRWATSLRGARGPVPHERCDLSALIVGCIARAACCGERCEKMQSTAPRDGVGGKRHK